MGETIKSILLFICICLVFNHVQGWVAMGKYYDEANPGKCTINAELIIEPGQTVKSPDDCANITCDSADGIATLIGCGAIAPPENCRWGEYINKHVAYPQCCERHAICTETTEDTKAHLQSIRNMLRASLSNKY